VRRCELFCDGHLLKETDQVDVSTETNSGVHVDGGWRWYWDGKEIDDSTATSMRAAYEAQQKFSDHMNLLTTQTGSAPADVRAIQAALLQLAESQRTLFVAPGEEEDMRAAVEARGWSGFVAVVGSHLCPPGHMLFSNTGAMEKAVRDAAARWLQKRPLR
jgi:UDP-N-acetylmuramoylalanine-D-glutamate ligase